MRSQLLHSEPVVSPPNGELYSEPDPQNQHRSPSTKVDRMSSRAKNVHPNCHDETGLGISKVIVYHSRERNMNGIRARVSRFTLSASSVWAVLSV